MFFDEILELFMNVFWQRVTGSATESKMRTRCAVVHKSTGSFTKQLTLLEASWWTR